MTIAESEGMRLAYVAESTEGTTPATPSFQNLRINSEALRLQKLSTQSQELRQDKNVSDIIHIGDSASGSFESELSYGSYDDLLAGLLRGAWSSDVLTNGTTRSSFTFEKTAEQGATDSYMRYRGMFVDGLNLNVQSGQPVSCTWNLMGMGGDDGATTIITGATYSSVNTNEIMAAETYFGSVTVTGIGTVPAIKGLSLSIRGNNREQRQIGSTDLAGIALGQFVVEGTISFYFTAVEVYNAIRDHDEAGLQFTLGTVTGEKYTINIPKARFMEGDPQASGLGQDVAFDVSFQGYYDSGIGGTMRITRAVA